MRSDSSNAERRRNFSMFPLSAACDVINRTAESELVSRTYISCESPAGKLFRIFLFYYLWIFLHCIKLLEGRNDIGYIVCHIIFPHCDY
uniref:Uncharacterized protein n=1 Tax=Ciona intestinalis TaxID=7719 RepID=H2XTW9_CIOIN